MVRQLGMILLIVVLLHISMQPSVLAQTSSVPTDEAATAFQKEKLQNTIELLSALPPDKQSEIAPDLERESTKHFGLPAIKSVSDLNAVNVQALLKSQLSPISTSTDHVVIDHLIPAIVKPGTLVPKGEQLFPELTSDIKKLQSSNFPTLLKSVGRIRYGVKPTSDFLSGGYLAGTGFVVAPGVVATACHVVDAFLDSQTLSLSDALWAAIDFGTAAVPDHPFSIKGILGRSQIQGFDVVLLNVSKQSIDNAIPLPNALKLEAVKEPGPDIGVAGYPDFEHAVTVCNTPGNHLCDETEQYFYAYKTKNSDAIKIISPGKRTDTALQEHGGFHIFTYNAPTLEGQSGSPVFDLSSLKVVGVHYCCTGNPDPANEPQPCARIKPLSLGKKSDNEAISVKDLYSDISFKSVVTEP